MSAVHMWTVVPDGSKFELSVNEPDGGASTFVAQAFVLVDTGGQQEWKDAVLRPGPKTLKVKSPRLYDIRVNVLFSGTARAVVRARIIKPDGNVYGQPYEHTLSGKNGDTQFATILVVTKK